MTDKQIPVAAEPPVSNPPAYFGAFDSDWLYYVEGHDEEALWVVDDPADLRYERLYMREIRASQCEDFGLCDDDPDDTVLRDPVTGRFTARTVWIECHAKAVGAHPYMGCRYKPVALTQSALPTPASDLSSDLDGAA